MTDALWAWGWWFCGRFVVEGTSMDKGTAKDRRKQMQKSEKWKTRGWPLVIRKYVPAARRRVPGKAAKGGGEDEEARNALRLGNGERKR